MSPVRAARPQTAKTPQKAPVKNTETVNSEVRDKLNAIVGKLNRKDMKYLVVLNAPPAKVV